MNDNLEKLFHEQREARAEQEQRRKQIETATLVLVPFIAVVMFLGLVVAPYVYQLVRVHP